VQTGHQPSRLGNNEIRDAMNALPEQTFPEIGQVIGTDKHPGRWSELHQNSAKISASQPS
jgi:hypothetical protein